ncbi:hypothetical protein [Iningainema tapete]|uniref:Uncharacterized protein n=1 Tax=Iningainema tapete BLCC-T55 TaxID=2748662 RepID=A0A8J6XD76_9CYAN|nr:hypothetical protein [Iningainema tapete]MBD2771128.1 hypothetical protein [Iningainema tapete BLCC-T55]
MIERVVNIVWQKDPSVEEGRDTNSCFRVQSAEHEQELLASNKFIVESSVAEASPLTCRISDRHHHEHGCYSAE